MRGIHLGSHPVASPGSPGTPPGRITFTVVDDVLYLVDPVTGHVFEAPVVFVGPNNLPSGLITADADTLYFHYSGGTWSSPASVASEGTAPVGGIILNDRYFVTIASVTYEMPVTSSATPGSAPSGEMSLVTIEGIEYVRIVFSTGEVRYEEMHGTPMPDAESGIYSTLVTGSDGAQYEKTSYPDGTIRYKPLYEDIEFVPGEVPVSGSTVVTGTDGADYERTVYYDGTVRYKATYETLP